MANITLIYVVFFLSFFCMYAAFRRESKPIRYLIVCIYLAAGLLFSALLVSEMLQPSVGANIGLGFAVLVVYFISFFGFIVSGILFLTRNSGGRSRRGKA